MHRCTFRTFAPTIAIACACTAACSHADAQIVRSGGLSPFVKDYRIDFAIPDAPAFKLLEVDRSVILRPQTARDLVLALDGFRGDGNAFVVPKQIGIEFSPGLLIGGGQLRLADYTARKYLYATRLSGATNRDSLGRGQLATGIRFSILDEQDIRDKSGGGTDSVVTAFTRRILDVYEAIRDRVGPRAPLVLTDTEQRLIDAVSDSIEQYWADRYWNASALDLAFGARARTADTLGHDPSLDEAAGWFTYANGLQGWGQLQLGAKLGAARDTSGGFHASNTLAARLYVGSNALKGFVEAQQSLASRTDAQWLLNSGVEFRLPGIGWIDASAGYASPSSGERGRVISSFKFRAGVP
jgi:hypothetical protein